MATSVFLANALTPTSLTVGNTAITADANNGLDFTTAATTYTSNFFTGNVVDNAYEFYIENNGNSGSPVNVEIDAKVASSIISQILLIVQANGTSFNRLRSFGTTSGFEVREQSGDVRLIAEAAGKVILLASDTTLENGKALKTDTTTGHTALVQAYDVDGTAYKTFATLTNGNTPDLTVAPPSGGTVTLQASTFKSSDGTSGASAGPFTTISSITVKNGLVTALTGS